MLYTKSITEVLAAVRELDPATHGVLVIDSISHLWDACRNAFTGRVTKAGTIPLHAWGAIKKPYKELMHLLLTTPVHVLICGRQGIDFGEDEESGELKNLGYKMRAEGETAYEPDVLVRLEAHKADRKKIAVPVAHVEKDRTGVLAGRTIPWPTFDNLARPLLGLLGATQAALPTDDEVGMQDAEALAREEADRIRRSAEMAAEYTGRIRAGGDGDGVAADWRGADGGGEDAAGAERSGAGAEGLCEADGEGEAAGGGGRSLERCERDRHGEHRAGSSG